MICWFVGLLVSAPLQPAALSPLCLSLCICPSLSLSCSLPPYLPLIHFSLSTAFLSIHQFVPHLRGKEALRTLTDAARESLEKTVPEYIRTKAKIKTASSGVPASWGEESGLYDFVTTVMFESVVQAVFGDSLAKADLRQDFIDFDLKFAEAAGGIPLKFFKTAFAAKQRLNQIFIGGRFSCRRVSE